jgi:UDP-N-acetylglucosamine 4,6-dehydratase/5-epimerase
MIENILDNSTVLVTGGTGSFGRRFIDRLLQDTKVGKIIVFSRDELKQSQMMIDIADPDGRMRYFLGDVRDVDRLQRAFRDVDYVIHAAALKQVPALEYNPFEAVKTNIIGTQNIITAALDQGVKKVVLVSTDKAANPANLYGATKLCAERLMIAANSYSGDGGCRFGIVRYGNVLGSRGSLLTVVERQRPTGEITITHEDMTRFWITLDQGVDLVLHALVNMYGGETFVPKIPAMSVKSFIEHVASECKLRVTGIRPGEKIHETLVTKQEARHTVDGDKHYIILPESEDWPHRSHYGKYDFVDDDFEYSSDNMDDVLDAERLDMLLKNI